MDAIDPLTMGTITASISARASITIETIVWETFAGLRHKRFEEPAK
jgi:hypothetical protein